MRTWSGTATARRTHHDGSVLQKFGVVWRWRAQRHSISDSARSAKPCCRNCTVFQPQHLCACIDDTDSNLRQEQDGEHAMLRDFDAAGMLNDCAGMCRVSTSKNTTSRRATALPPRARTRTCSCSSRCVSALLKCMFGLTFGMTLAVPLPRPAHGFRVQQGPTLSLHSEWT